MAEPSSSTLDNLGGRLHEYNKLAEEQLDKGEDSNEKLLARYQEHATNLAAEIKCQASREI